SASTTRFSWIAVRYSRTWATGSGSLGVPTHTTNDATSIATLTQPHSRQLPPIARSVSAREGVWIAAASPVADGPPASATTPSAAPLWAGGPASTGDPVAGGPPAVAVSLLSSVELLAAAPSLPAVEAESVMRVIVATARYRSPG